MKSLWRKTAAIAGLAAILALSLPLREVRAAEDTCDFQPKFDALRSIQVDAARDYIEAIKAQLRVRKDLLKAVVDCASKEIRQRQNDLKQLPPEYQNSPTAQSISKDLDAAAAFYGDKRKSIDNLGIKGTQDLAKDISFWRSHNYKAVTDRQDNFELWANNQSLFQKTTARFAQMRPVVLSVTLIDHQDIAAEWKSAEDQFKDAEDKNRAAKDALENNPEAAPDLIKSSLENLSQIYKKFMKVADDIKGTVQ
jgi:hypothetical protein